jgi:hypothetical protein
MPRMQITKDRSAGTILGPCPGCEMWTIQYDPDVMGEWPTHDAFAAVIEDLLGEHLDECRGLQEIVFEKI